MKRVFIMLAIVLGSAGLLFAQKSNQKGGGNEAGKR